MPETELLAVLKRATGAFEAYHRTEYVLYREKEGVGTQTVTVEILDGGTSRGDLRYHVYARGDDGTSATGNPADSLDVAVAIVHWGDLDR